MNKTKGEGKIFTEFNVDKVTKRSIVEKAILPFLKTYTIDEEDCQLGFKMFNGKIYIV